MDGFKCRAGKLAARSVPAPTGTNLRRYVAYGKQCTDLHHIKAACAGSRTGQRTIAQQRQVSEAACSDNKVMQWSMTGEVMQCRWQARNEGGLHWPQVVGIARARDR